MAKKLSKKHIKAVADFTETEIYAELVVEIKKNGLLPTDDAKIAKLLRKATNRAIEKLSSI